MSLTKNQEAIEIANATIRVFKTLQENACFGEFMKISNDLCVGLESVGQGEKAGQLYQDFGLLVKVATTGSEF